MPISHHNPDNPKAICLAMGDPQGIGPEITVKYLQQPGAALRPLLIVGHLSTLKQTAETLDMPLPNTAQIRYIDIPGDPLHQSGQIAYQALETSVALIAQQQAQALVTGPVSKALLWHAGLQFSGQTEILAYLSQQFYGKSYRPDMLFVYHAFRMLLLTRHIPLREVARTLNSEDVFLSLDNLVRFLQTRMGINKPKLCVMGLNPHASELGEEEDTILMPGIIKINKRHQLATQPPVPADALFRGFNARAPQHDAYIACYHDQGLIPFKLLAGLQGVNVSIGLPFIRTSVSHGMASDIVGQGIASPESLSCAVELACQMI